MPLCLLSLFFLCLSNAVIPLAFCSSISFPLWFIVDLCGFVTFHTVFSLISKDPPPLFFLLQWNVWETCEIKKKKKNISWFLSGTPCLTCVGDDAACFTLATVPRRNGSSWIRQRTLLNRNIIWTHTDVRPLPPTLLPGFNTHPQRTFLPRVTDNSWWTCVFPQIPLDRRLPLILCATPRGLRSFCWALES